MVGRTRKASRRISSSKKNPKALTLKGRGKTVKLPASLKRDYESDESTNSGSIQNLLDAANTIDDSKKNKGKGSSKQKPLIQPTTRGKKQNEKQSIEPAVLQALGADELNDDGKKAVKELMTEYDPKMLNALFGKIANIQQYRKQSKDEPPSSENGQDSPSGSQSDSGGAVSYDKKNIYPQPYPFPVDVMYPPPFMMMQPLYYQSHIQNYQQPSTSQEKSSLVMPVAQSSSSSSNPNIQTTHQQAIKAESELVIMPSNFQNVPITQATTTYQGVTTETSPSSIPYAVTDSLREKLDTTHAVSSSKGIFKNTDISVAKKPLEHASIGTVEDAHEQDGICDTLDEDSNMSAEFPAPQPRTEEEMPTDSLSKYMSQTDYSTPRVSFMNFVENINDSSADIHMGSGQYLSFDQTSSAQLINNAASTVDQKQADKELPTEKDVVVISDDDTENIADPLKNPSKKDFVLDKQANNSQDVQVGKSYHNLTSVKKNDQVDAASEVKNFITEKTDKRQANMLQHLMSLSPEAINLLKILQSYRAVVLKRPAQEPPNHSDQKRPRISYEEKFSNSSSNLNYKDRGKNEFGNNLSSIKPNGLSRLHLQDEDGDIMLHIAIAKEDVPLSIDIIKKMKGFRLDTINKLGQTPLHMSLYVHQLDIIRELLHHGADPSILDGHGNSVIHIACEEESISMIRCMFDFEAHRDTYLKIMKTKNYQGRAALHIALYKRHEEIIKELIEYGADLDVQDETSGASILVTAIQQRNWPLTYLLIKKGANVNLSTYSSYYPLHYAASVGNMDLVKLLLSYEAEIGSKTVEYEVNNVQTQAIKVLLDKEMRKRRRRRNLNSQQNNS